LEDPVRSFGVRQLAAALVPAGVLTKISIAARIPASKLAGDKAAASRRTPKLCNRRNLEGIFRSPSRRGLW
jgi:hypothetical protein